MPNIIVPSRSLCQYGEPRINWSNPITRGIVNFIKGPYCINGTAIKSGGKYIPYKTGILFNGEYTAYLATSSSHTLNNPFTIACDFIYKSSTAVNHGILHMMQYYGNGFKLCISGSQQILFTYSGVVDFWFNYTLTENTLIRITIVAKDGADLYINGKFIEHQGNQSMGQTTMPITLGIATDESNGGYSQGNVVLWNRALSSQEIASEAANPSQLFQSEVKQSYFDVPQIVLPTAVIRTPLTLNAEGGLIDPSLLGSGTPAGDTFLRGDGTWQTL